MAFGDIVQIASHYAVWSNPWSFSFPGNVTAGNTIIIAVEFIDFDSGSALNNLVLDSLGHTYVRDVTEQQVSDYYINIFRKSAITGGTCTISFPWTASQGLGNNPWVFAVAIEYSGNFVLDKTATGLAGDTLSSGNTATTTVANEFLVCIGAIDGGATFIVGTNFSHLQQPIGRIAFEDRIVSSMAAYSGGFTLNNTGYSSVTSLMTYSQAAGGTVNLPITHADNMIIGSGGSGSSLVRSNLIG